MTIRRIPIIAVLLAASSIALADELDARVSFEAKALSAKSAIEQLGAKAGVALLVSGQVADEPLILRFHDVPLRQAMDKIGAALHAEWLKEGNGYRLVRNSRQQRELAEEVLAHDAARIAKRLQALRDEMAKFGAYTAERAKIEFEIAEKNRAAMQERLANAGNGGPVIFDSGQIAQSTSPILYALRNVIAGMDARSLAALPYPTRTVFALTPTQMQRPMPPHGQRALASYIQLHNTYARLGANAPQTGRVGTEQWMIGDQRISRPLEGGIGEALLIATRPGPHSIQFQLVVADMGGTIVAEANHFLEFDGGAPAPQSGSASVEEPVALSEDAKKHASLMRYVPSASPASMIMVGRPGGGRTAVRLEVTGSGPGGPTPAVPKPVFGPDWRNILLQPEKWEPLSYAAAELLLGAAKAQNRNLVALVPDEAVLRYSNRCIEPLKPTDVWRIAEAGFGSQVVLTEGWAEIRPAVRERARQNRMSRMAFGQLLRSIDRDGALRLDAAANFVKTRTGRHYGGGFADRYVGLINASAARPFSSALTHEYEATKLYGLLDPVRKRQLAEGGRLPLGLLSPQERALAHDLVFASMDGPNIDRQRGNPDGGPNERSVQRFSTDGGTFAVGGLATALADERTELFPFGLPVEGFLTIASQSEPAVYATSPTVDDGKFFTAREYGLYRTMATDNVRLANAQLDFPAYERFRLGSRVIHTLTIQLGPFAEVERHLSDFTLQPNANTMTYEQLPEDFRKEAESMAGRIRFGGPPPPPTGR